MAQAEGSMALEGLAEAVGEAVTFLAEQVRAALGANLESVTVVGSALTSDYRAGASDINTVIVLGEYNLAALKAIVGLAKSMRKKRVSAPLLMTGSYIERSRDVFGVEFLDFQLTHRTVVGNDPFAELTFAKGDVRLQCERELKATLIRLRQGYIAAAGNRKLVRDVLISAAKGLAPLLRAMLWLKDGDRPRTMAATLVEAGSALSVDLEQVAQAARWRHEKARLDEGEILQAFEVVYRATDELARIVDGMEVA